MNTLIRRLVERGIQRVLQRGIDRGVQGGLSGLNKGCGSRVWVLLLVAVVGCCLVAVLSSGLLSGLGGLLGGGSTTGSTSGGSAGGSNLGNGVRIGRLVTATATNRDGCADGRTTRFRGDEAIYVVAESSDFPRGTAVFVRLYRGQRAVEDADAITAEQDYRNACVSFVFEASRAAGQLESGDYEAELFVNGNSAGSVKFTVD